MVIEIMCELENRETTANEYLCKCNGEISRGTHMCASKCEKLQNRKMKIKKKMWK